MDGSNDTKSRLRPSQSRQCELQSIVLILLGIALVKELILGLYIPSAPAKGAGALVYKAAF